MDVCRLSTSIYRRCMDISGFGDGCCLLRHSDFLSTQKKELVVGQNCYRAGGRDGCWLLLFISTIECLGWPCTAPLKLVG